MHEGHRRRMYEKLKNNDGLNDHELIEILLFNALPRVNTNPIAHKLLETFGSLSGVLNAQPEQLVTVEGIGASTAMYIKCIAECMRRTNLSYAGIAVMKNHTDLKEFAVQRMRGNVVEVVELYCLDRMGRVRRIHEFTNNDYNFVNVEADKLSEALITDKPHSVMVAHNHLGGSSKPSKEDDEFTAKISFICSLNNVILLDHMIYATDKDVFSYYLSGKLDRIKKDLSFNTILNDKIEKLFGPSK